ncbi:PAS domain S-box protein [Halobacillus shinanisalinarum]|uniref:PAS domain S-box protein n=1 Tax=Halobacillus shinanisalinarum TaxID=2932258 RepID=A0ABY4H463_9BACI|nr:sensor domain-containing diguanylate cyclase [Halobacillus shinanisalinarum]UOQ94367.1 PAS domain S-box protein [Halobacillus shinanisalinarum]
MGHTLLTPFMDETGKVVQILAMTKDITELAKKEQELDPVHAVYRSLLKNTADAILIVELDGKVLETNPAFEKLYGFTKEELKKERFPFVPFSLKSEADELIEKAVRKKHISAYETKRRHKNGDWVDVSVTVSPIYGNDGTVIGVSSIIRNISEQKIMNQKLKAGRSRYQSLFEFNPHPIVTLTLRGTITKANPAVLQMLNLKEDELLHSSITKWVHGEEIDHVKQHMRGSISGKKMWFQTRFMARSNERIVNVFLTPILTGQRKDGMYAILEDITEKEAAVKALKQSEAKFKLIADHSQDLISVFSPYGKLMYGSPSHVDFFGFDPTDADVDKIATVVHPKEMGQLAEHFVHCYRGTDPFFMNLRFLNALKEWVWFDVRGIPVLDDQAKVTHIVVVCRDITGQINYEEMLKSYAFYDYLTELPNRRKFEDCLTETLAKSRESHLPFALLYLDGDSFKQINDDLGHDKGDTFLRLIGKRLAQWGDNKSVIARIGGDEFAILLKDLADVKEARNKAEDLLIKLREPYQVGEHTVYSSFSIGVSLYPLDADTKEELFHKSDQALYYGKQQGKDTIFFYQDMK